jgi:hypothetical protein
LSAIPEIRPGQSIELLKALHILTRDGKLNQDSRRKLKQVHHLCHFIEPLLSEIVASGKGLTLVDHGAGKSYLGFLLYDLFFTPGTTVTFTVSRRAQNSSSTRAAWPADSVSRACPS